jgi:dihydrolipoamide dehydrogenase
MKSSSHQLGISFSNISLDFNQMMQRKQEIVNGLVQGIAGLFKQHKIERIIGNAKFLDPHSVDVAGKKISSDYIVIATGSEPIALPSLPFDENIVVSSTGALSFNNIPKRLLVVGGGSIGVELASVYQRLGTDVAIIEMKSSLIPMMDHSVSAAFLQLLKKQGIEFFLSAKVTEVERNEQGIKISVEQENKTLSLEGDRILVSVGRRPYVNGLELEKIGVLMDRNKMIQIDRNFRTSQPHIYAIGDVVEGPMLAHKASHEGIAAVEVIAGLPVKINYLAIPNVVYTNPEVASVGLTENEAVAAGIKPLIGKSFFRGNARARCTGTIDGFVKVIGDSHSRRLIGMHILAAHASEMITEGVVAINKHASLEELASSMHPHPTLSETVMEACQQALF